MPILEYTASGNILLFCNFFVVHFQEVIHQQSFTVTLGQLFQVKLVNPKLYGRGYAIGDMGHTDYVLVADDIVAVEEK